jgi:3-deoxy-manno-octulosonate cytidylyltransferase (CMP-KDO synthetase)
MKVAVIIPARLHSRRFPRKVLARDTGKYLIEHVWERVAGCPGIDRVIIATDSDEVEAAGRSFGAEVARTSADHVSGTDRVAEAAARLAHDVIVNVQGDEPQIVHQDLEALLALFTLPRRGERAGCGRGGGRRDEVVMTTLAVERHDPEGFHDPNVVKAVVAEDGRALYFSRSPVPYADPAVTAGGGGAGGGGGGGGAGGGSGGGGAPAAARWLQHVGIYAYRRDFLLELSRLPPTALERRERLEQLRVLENGYPIRVGLSLHPHLGIDTEEEYRRFVAEHSSI